MDSESSQRWIDDDNESSRSIADGLSKGTKGRIPDRSTGF